MTPIGHISVSYILTAKASKATVFAAVIAALVVDFDFIFLPFPWFNDIHRVVTHNIFFVLIIGLLGYLIVKKDLKKYVFIGILFGGLSHLLLDAMMDTNPSNGMGVAFFWPLINQNFLIYNIFPSATEYSPGWGNPKEMLKFTFHTILIELPFYIFATTLYIFKKTRKTKLKTVH